MTKPPPPIGASIIEGPAASGTAVIIGKSKNVYTFLTAKHVVSDASSSEPIFINPQNTGEELKVFGIEAPMGAGADIAIGRFKYDGDLRIAVINSFWKSKFSYRCTYGPPNLDLTCEDDISMIPSPVGRTWETPDSGVQIVGYSLPSAAITSRIRRTISGDLLPDRALGNKDGYEMLYQASTTPGISGGPIYGARAFCGPYFKHYSLLGVHGRSEDYFAGGRSGTSLGIPIVLIKNYLLQRAEEFGIPVKEAELRELVESQYCQHEGKYFIDSDGKLHFYDNRTAEYLSKQNFFKQMGLSPISIDEFKQKQLF